MEGHVPMEASGQEDDDIMINQWLSNFIHSRQHEIANWCSGLPRTLELSALDEYNQKKPVKFARFIRG